MVFHSCGDTPPGGELLWNGAPPCVLLDADSGVRISLSVGVLLSYVPASASFGLNLKPISKNQEKGGRRNLLHEVVQFCDAAVEQAGRVGGVRAVLPEGREGTLQLVREGHVRVARAGTRAARAIRVLRLVRPVPSSPPRILPSPFIPIPVIRPRPRRRVIRPPSPPAVLGDILVIPHGRGRGRRRGGREPVQRPASPGGVVGRGLGFDGGRGRAGALGSGERGAFGRAGVPFFVWVAVPEGAVGPAGVGVCLVGGISVS